MEPIKINSFFPLIGILCLSILSCGDSADEGFIEAFVGINCGGSINHTGDDVYAYNAADLFYTQSIQAGGHSNGSTTDIGVNIFNGNSLVMEGELIKEYGDGCIILFENSIDALNAGLSLQKSFTKGDVKIPLRIGIHVGELIHKEKDVFGNGINIAARIESMSVPGSVVISEQVWLKAKNHPEFEFQILGKFEFKNVDEHICLFALKNQGLIVPKYRQMIGKGKKVFYSRIQKLKELAGLIFIVLFTHVSVEILIISMGKFFDQGANQFAFQFLT